MVTTRQYRVRSCGAKRSANDSEHPQMLRALRAGTANAHGAVRRMPSPPVSRRSTLITSAPISASSCPHVGPAITCVLRSAVTRCQGRSPGSKKNTTLRVVSQLYNFDARQHPSTGGRVSAKASTRCRSVHLNQRVQHLVTDRRPACRDAGCPRSRAGASNIDVQLLVSPEAPWSGVPSSHP